MKGNKYIAKRHSAKFFFTCWKVAAYILYIIPYLTEETPCLFIRVRERPPISFSTKSFNCLKSISFNKEF